MSALRRSRRNKSAITKETLLKNKKEFDGTSFASFLAPAFNEPSARSRKAARCLIQCLDDAASLVSQNFELLHERLVCEDDFSYNFINNLLPDEAVLVRKKGEPLRLFQDLYSGRLESLEQLSTSSRKLIRNDQPIGLTRKKAFFGAIRLHRLIELYSKSHKLDSLVAFINRKRQLNPKKGQDDICHLPFERFTGLLWLLGYKHDRTRHREAKSVSDAFLLKVLVLMEEKLETDNKKYMELPEARTLRECYNMSLADIKKIEAAAFSAIPGSIYDEDDRKIENSFKSSEEESDGEAVCRDEETESNGKTNEETPPKGNTKRKKKPRKTAAPLFPFNFRLRCAALALKTILEKYRERRMPLNYQLPSSAEFRKVFDLPDTPPEDDEPMEIVEEPLCGAGPATNCPVVVFFRYGWCSRVRDLYFEVNETSWQIRDTQASGTKSTVRANFIDKKEEYEEGGSLSKHYVEGEDGVNKEGLEDFPIMTFGQKRGIQTVRANLLSYYLAKMSSELVNECNEETNLIFDLYKIQNKKGKKIMRKEMKSASKRYGSFVQQFLGSVEPASLDEVPLQKANVSIGKIGPYSASFQAHGDGCHVICRDACDIKKKCHANGQFLPTRADLPVATCVFGRLPKAKTKAQKEAHMKEFGSSGSCQQGIMWRIKNGAVLGKGYTCDRDLHLQFMGCQDKNIIHDINHQYLPSNIMKLAKMSRNNLRATETMRMTYHPREDRAAYQGAILNDNLHKHTILRDYAVRGTHCYEKGTEHYDVTRREALSDKRASVPVNVDVSASEIQGWTHPKESWGRPPTRWAPLTVSQFEAFLATTDDERVPVTDSQGSTVHRENGEVVTVAGLTQREKCVGTRRQLRQNLLRSSVLVNAAFNHKALFEFENTEYQPLWTAHGKACAIGTIMDAVDLPLSLGQRASEIMNPQVPNLLAAFEIYKNHPLSTILHYNFACDFEKYCQDELLPLVGRSSQPNDLKRLFLTQKWIELERRRASLPPLRLCGKGGSSQKGGSLVPTVSTASPYDCSTTTGHHQDIIHDKTNSAMVDNHRLGSVVAVCFSCNTWEWAQKRAILPERKTSNRLSPPQFVAKVIPALTKKQKEELSLSNKDLELIQAEVEKAIQRKRKRGDDNKTNDTARPKNPSMKAMQRTRKRVDNDKTNGTAGPKNPSRKRKATPRKQKKGDTATPKNLSMHFVRDKKDSRYRMMGYYRLKSFRPRTISRKKRNARFRCLPGFLSDEKNSYNANFTLGGMFEYTYVPSFTLQQSALMFLQQHDDNFEPMRVHVAENDKRPLIIPYNQMPEVSYETDSDTDSDDDYDFGKNEENCDEGKEIVHTQYVEREVVHGISLLSPDEFFRCVSSPHDLTEDSQTYRIDIPSSLAVLFAVAGASAEKGAKNRRKYAVLRQANPIGSARLETTLSCKPNMGPYADLLPMPLRMNPMANWNSDLDAGVVYVREQVELLMESDKWKSLKSLENPSDPDFIADCLFIAMSFRLTGFIPLLEQFPLYMEDQHPESPFQKLSLPIPETAKDFCDFLHRSPSSTFCSQQHKGALPAFVEEKKTCSNFFYNATTNMELGHGRIKEYLAEAGTDVDRVALHCIIKRMIVDCGNLQMDDSLDFLAHKIIADIESKFPGFAGAVVIASIGVWSGSIEGLKTIIFPANFADNLDNTKPSQRQTRAWESKLLFFHGIILELLWGLTEIELNACGWSRNENGDIVSICGRRLYSLTDSEHGLCKLWLAARASHTSREKGTVPEFFKYFVFPMVHESESKWELSATLVLETVWEAHVKVCQEIEDSICTRYPSKYNFPPRQDVMTHRM